MIDWILGILIFGAAALIIVKMFIKSAKGESFCCSSGCSCAEKEKCHYSKI
ncbi:MAG: FeoB-associated Cys-rich membrane protein [Firmicutes bacterium]|nr:FeoB-associated Cys-rich membrane protein [Bacillota bacterium]